MILLQDSVLAQKIRSCSECPVRREIRMPVPGEGPQDATIIFIGRNPGKNEDLKNRPFIGRAGVLLDKIIKFLGFEREQCGIVNTIRCFTPANRAPTPKEIETCKYWLKEELKFFSSKKILFPCGAEAFKSFLPQCPDSISRVVGKAFHPESSKIITIPLYHPAYILRNPSKEVELFNYTLPRIKNYLESKMKELN